MLVELFDPDFDRESVATCPGNAAFECPPVRMDSLYLTLLNLEGNIQLHSNNGDGIDTDNRTRSLQRSTKCKLCEPFYPTDIFITKYSWTREKNGQQFCKITTIIITFTI